MDVSTEFIRTSRRYLIGEYLPKIERCLSMLTEEDAWWRPNEKSNSIENLVLHLSGNLRQYVVSGVGAKPDIRQRDEEFAPGAGGSPRDLADHLRTTVEEAADVLSKLDPAALPEQRRIQGREMTVFAAIYHAVEHFSMHTGQIIQTTKQLKNADLEFYTFERGSVQRRW